MSQDPAPAPKRTPPPRNPRARRVAILVTLILPLIYAGFFRWAFATAAFTHSGGVVSMSFVFSVPFAMGVLSVAIGRWIGSDHWQFYAAVAPSLSLLLGLVICIVIKIEAAICVIMAAPILIACVMIGGLLAHWLMPRNHPSNRLYLPLIVLLPVFSAGIEGSMQWPTEIKAIENVITVDAPAEEVWKEITSVEAIDPAQLPKRWIYRVGFPRPIAATLDREGVGGVRTATFERDVSFFETVTEWDAPRKLAFSIHADPDFIPHTAFDRHIIVGGRFYDVLDGVYEIEPVSASRCRLHLTSHHRLSTRFNSYAGWWSERIMDQIQGSIMEVVRQRAEQAHRQSHAAQ